MIARPDYIRRKYVLVGLALACGVLLLVLLNDSAGSSRSRGWAGVNRPASFVPASGGLVAREVAYDAWRPYDPSLPRDAWSPAPVERRRSP
jgi:hypothetical protein